MFVGDMLIQAFQVDDWPPSWIFLLYLKDGAQMFSWFEFTILIATFSKSVWISISTNRDCSQDVSTCLGYLLWQGASEKGIF